MNVLLTPRQEQICRLIGEGLANKEIAYQIGVREGTVKVYLHRVFKLLGVKSRTQIALLVARHQLPGQLREAS